MYNINVYSGKPVKSTTKDGIFEIIKVDYTTDEVICVPMNSIESRLETFRISTLIDL
jgi:hypothetical protein